MRNNTAAGVRDKRDNTYEPTQNRSNHFESRKHDDDDDQRINILKKEEEKLREKTRNPIDYSMRSPLENYSGSYLTYSDDNKLNKASISQHKLLDSSSYPKHSADNLPNK